MIFCITLKSFFQNYNTSDFDLSKFSTFSKIYNLISIMMNINARFNNMHCTHFLDQYFELSSFFNHHNKQKKKMKNTIMHIIYKRIKINI